jgi:hypothetical protein
VNAQQRTRRDRAKLRGMGFMDRAKDMAGRHDDKVDQGLDNAGEAAKGRLAGHDEQIDSAVDQAQQRTGEGDTTQATPPEAAPDQQAEGVDPAQEVPGGPQPDVPAGPGSQQPPPR